MLSEYGFTVDDIREYKQLCAKAEAAANELYGEDGWKISAGLKDEYLKENYVAFRQIYLANSYNLFELDANGDVIYYDGKGNVAYDTVNGKAEMGEGGKIVYYTEDGRIAYDKKSGKPSPVIDDILARIGNRYNIPVIRNEDFGHGANGAIFPISTRAKLDTDTLSFEFLESGVE